MINSKEELAELFKSKMTQRQARAMLFFIEQLKPGSVRPAVLQAILDDVTDSDRSKYVEEGTMTINKIRATYIQDGIMSVAEARAAMGEK